MPRHRLPDTFFFSRLRILDPLGLKSRHVWQWALFRSENDIDSPLTTQVGLGRSSFVHDWPKVIPEGADCSWNICFSTKTYSKLSEEVCTTSYIRRGMAQYIILASLSVRCQCSAELCCSGLCVPLERTGQHISVITRAWKEYENLLKVQYYWK